MNKDNNENKDNNKEENATPEKDLFATVTMEELSEKPAPVKSAEAEAELEEMFKEPSESDKPSEKVKAERRAGWLVRDIFEWGETLVSAVITIVIIFTFFVRVTSVDGHSMNPTLIDKDQMLVSNFFYTPKHNDIVVIYAPALEGGKDIIKRVVGVAGDTIRIEPIVYGGVYGEQTVGLVYRNGEPLEVIDVDGVLVEDGHKISSRTVSNRQMAIEVTIQPGYVFVLGDNRTNSTDSRSELVGLVDVNYIAGRAFFRAAGDSQHWGTFYNAFGTVE